jgi:hypothetical protein
MHIVPSQKQHSLQRSVSWDFSEDKPYLEDADETGEHPSDEFQVKEVRFGSNANQPVNSSSSNEVIKEKKGRFLINADDDDDDDGANNHQPYVDTDRLGDSVDLNMSTSMELAPDGDNKTVSVQKGRFSVTEDSDDENNINNNNNNNNQSQHRRNQSQTVDNYPVQYINHGNIVNNPSNELPLSTNDTTKTSTALYSSHRLSTDLGE